VSNVVQLAVRGILQRCRRKPAREMQFLREAQADALLDSQEGWRLAPEQETNPVPGWTWIERDPR